MARTGLITLLILTFTSLCSFAPPALALSLFIAGDSTASEYGPERYPRMGWGQALGDFYSGEITVVDLAQSGRSAKSFIDEGFFAEVQDRIQPGDVLLIQFGHNDQKINSPERYAAANGAYSEYLREYVNMARDKGATPVLLTSVVRRKFENGVLVPTHGDYPQAVRDLAAEAGVALIDMTRLSRRYVSGLGEKESEAVYLHLTGPEGRIEDNTHFSERGAYAMAAMVARELDRLNIVSYQDPESGVAGQKAQFALQETKSIGPDEPVAIALATQHMERFPDPWLMRKSDGAYAWSYTHGLVLLGMEQLYRQTGDETYPDYIQSYADHFIDANGTIETLKITEFNIDSILAGRILFFLYERTGDSRYKLAMDSLRTQLQWQPRTHTGGFWHKRKYPWQIWLDGLYMGQPFYARYEKKFGDDPHDFDDIVSQFVVIEQKTRDTNTGLLYHGWDESALQPWADPETGLSPGFWSRAMGWYAMAIVDTVEQLPEGHPGREQLAGVLARLVDALIPFQDESGLWYQVTDQGSREGNWLEASGSSMFTYAIAKGVRLGLLEDEYLAVARRAYAGLLEHIISIDADGTVHVNDICRSAGLGGTPYRDGTYDYYVTTDRVRDDAHGIGSFLLAAGEMMRVD